MRLKSALKDWLRRRALAKAGIGIQVHRPRLCQGARSGMWTVDPTDLGPQSVVYSFGIGDNIAWELAMIEHFGCHVHAFDPTPRSLAWLRQQSLPQQLHVHPFGLAAYDGEQNFAVPAKPGDVNYRPLASGEGAGGNQALLVRRLDTLRRQLGHDRIDVLKIDIEGGEYGVLPDLLATGPRPKQLLIEFHHGYFGVPFQATRAALQLLQERGYRILDVSRRGLEFSLISGVADTDCTKGPASR